MGERRVLVVINPPEPGRCWNDANECRQYAGTFQAWDHRCRVNFVFGHKEQGEYFNGMRPGSCIAAEEQADKLAEDGETCRRVVKAIDKARSTTVLRAIFEPRDRVADALAAVFCTTKDQQ